MHSSTLVYVIAFDVDNRGSFCKNRIYNATEVTRRSDCST